MIAKIITIKMKVPAPPLSSSGLGGSSSTHGSTGSPASFFI